MPLVPCPHCGHSVSDQAAQCPGCGALRAPAVHPAYFAAPPAPAQGTSVPMRIGQGVAVAFCLLLGLAAADGNDSAEFLGEAVGYTLATLLISALFLAWSRRTRPYIPFLAVLFAGLSTVGQRAAVDDELAELKSATHALLDSSAATMPARSGEKPPSGRDAKMVWVARQFVMEVPLYAREVGARHGIDPDQPPTAWGTSRYMADAGAHPEVGRFWEAYGAYLAEVRRTYPAWGEARMETLGRQAGLSGRLRAQIVAGLRQSLEREDPFAAPGATAAAALDLHRFLLRVDERVHYDAGRDVAMFDDDAELEEAGRLQDRVNAAAQKVQEAQQRARLLPDSLARLLQ